MTDRDGGRREFFHRRGRSNQGTHDLEELSARVVARIQAHALACEDLCRLQLVSPEGQLAEEPVGFRASRAVLETEAELVLGICVLPEGQEGAGQ